MKFIIWMQESIVESHFRVQGFVPAFYGCPIYFSRRTAG